MKRSGETIEGALKAVQMELFHLRVAQREEAPVPSRLLRVDEAARYLAISESQVRKLVECGRLASVSIGDEAGVRTHQRITPESVRRFISGNA